MQVMQGSSSSVKCTQILDIRQLDKQITHVNIKWNFNLLRDFFADFSQCTPISMPSFQLTSCKFSAHSNMLKKVTNYFANDFSPGVISSALVWISDKRNYVKNMKVPVTKKEIEMFDEVYGIQPYFQAAIKAFPNLIEYYKKDSKWSASLFTISQMIDTIVKKIPLDPWDLSWNNRLVCDCLKSLKDWPAATAAGYDKENIKFFSFNSRSKLQRTHSVKAAPLEAAKTLIQVIQLLRTIVESGASLEEGELANCRSDWNEIKVHLDDFRKFIQSNIDYCINHKDRDHSQVIWQGLLYDLDAKPNKGKKEVKEFVEQLKMVYTITKPRNKKQIKTGGFSEQLIQPNTKVIAKKQSGPSSVISKKEAVKETPKSIEQQSESSTLQSTVKTESSSRKDFSNDKFANMLLKRTQVQDRFTLRKVQPKEGEITDFKDVEVIKNPNLLQELQEVQKKRLERRNSVRIPKGLFPEGTTIEKVIGDAHELNNKKQTLERRKSMSHLDNPSASRIMEALQLKFEVVQHIPICKVENSDGGVDDFLFLDGDDKTNYDIKLSEEEKLLLKEKKEKEKKEQEKKEAERNSFLEDLLNFMSFGKKGIDKKHKNSSTQN